MKSKNNRFAFGFATLMLCACAQAQTWDSSANAGIQIAAGAWSTSDTNWTVDAGVTRTGWTNGNAATFAGDPGVTPAAVALSGAITVNGITRTGNNSVSVNATSGNTLAISGTIDVGTGSRLTLSSTPGNGMNGSFIKAGAGLLEFIGNNGNHVYSGGVTLNAGTIGTTGNGNSLQGDAITLNGGAIGSLDNTLRQMDGAITIGGDVGIGAVSGTVLTNAVVNFGLPSLASSGSINLGAVTRTLNIASAVNFNNVVSSTGGGLTKAGVGNLTLARINTYTSPTTVNAGTLTLAFATITSNIINTGSALTLGGGTLALTGTGTQTVNGLTTTAATGSKIVLGANQTLTLGALTSAGANSALNFNTTVGGANGATVGTGVITLSGQAAGVSVGSPFTTTDVGGTGFATVNGSNQIVRLTSAALLPASGALSANDYWVDNNAGGAAAAGSAALTLTASAAARTITVDTATAPGTLTLDSGTVLSNNGWLFSGAGANPYQITGSAGGAGLTSVASGDALGFYNYNTGAVTLASPILANGTNAVTFEGTGTTILTAANTFSGGTTISGGTLRLGSGSTTGSLLAAGAIVNNGNLSINRSDAVTQSTIMSATGITGTGSLTQAGAGTTTLNVANTYSGATSVTAGRLIVSNALRNTSSLSVTGASSTLELGANNLLVSSHTTAVDASRVITADAGTLLMTSSIQSRIGNVTLTNGATWTSNRSLAAFDVLLGNVSTGAATVSVTGTGAATMNGTGGIHLQGQQNFNVADTTGSAATDLLVSMILSSPGSSGGSAGGINKQGPGTMTLTGVNTYNGATSLTGGGTLQVTTIDDLGGAGSIGVLSTASASWLGIRENSTLRITGTGTQTTSRFLWNDTGTGAGTFDVVDAGASVVFTATGGSINRELIKTGAGALTLTRQITTTGAVTVNGGSLTLAGANTYSGNTTVSAGTLNLLDNASLRFVIGANGVNNTLAGAGTATLAGDFVLDLTGANSTTGNSWQLVNVGTLTETYDATFSVVGFTEVANVHTLTAGPATWTFTEATGLLTVSSGTPFTLWIDGFTFAPGADKTPTGDPDGDGVNNQAEFSFGLIPNDGSSVNAITVQVDKTAGTFTYTRRKPSLTGLNNYKVWTSTNLSGWTQDLTAVQTPTDVGDNQNVVVTLTGAPLTETKFFVRVTAD
jgi:fibronectin-binding autotransporter adhesin